MEFVWVVGWMDEMMKNKQGQGDVAAWLGRVSDNTPTFRASTPGSKDSVDRGENEELASWSSQWLGGVGSGHVGKPARAHFVEVPSVGLWIENHCVPLATRYISLYP